ncbi:MAG: 2-dehydro-3-deoxygalactonokinase [Rhodospirillales bacterium]|nr:2-dehydro-3-deoxygalactonokinase [Rhodospirillales bacterium]
MVKTAPIIAVDWGTSALRVALVGEDGRVERRAESPDGILHARDGDFAGVFARMTAGWPSLPVFAAGMIGSRQGWREVPYLRCPTGLDELAAALAEVAPGFFIVPGVVATSTDGTPDVMRGEETQVLGTGISDGIVVLPGTHSKWVRVERGRIASFATFMTGEVFAVLTQHSILGRLMAGDEQDDAAFARGLARGREEKGALLHDLFSVRTLGLFGAIPETGLRSYLSGVLIGNEIAAAMRLYVETPRAVVGAPALMARYRQAFETMLGKAPAPVVAEAATVRGLVALASLR